MKKLINRLVLSASVLVVLSGCSSLQTARINFLDKPTNYIHPTAYLETSYSDTSTTSKKGSTLNQPSGTKVDWPILDFCSGQNYRLRPRLTSEPQNTLGYVEFVGDRLDKSGLEMLKIEF